MFVHLHCHSPFSFLDGAGDLAGLVRRAAGLEMPALALTDHDNLCGAAEFCRAAENAGIRPIVGAEVTLDDGCHLTLLAETRKGYANLCRLLTRAHLDNPRGRPRTTWENLADHREGLIALSGCRRGEVPSLVLAGHLAGARRAAERYLDLFGPDHFFLELQNLLLPGDRGLNEALAGLAGDCGLQLAATNNVHYAEKEQFPIHDLLTCVRTLTKLQEVHPERRLNAENYLKSPTEMRLLFRRHPRALANTLEIAGRCGRVLELGGSLHPEFHLPPGTAAGDYLRDQVYRGARERHGRLIPALRARLDHELAIINQLGYADYFLLTWDLVRFARREGIRCAGRGSAADSAVAYCLYLTEVDAAGRGLLFERFMSLERAEKPDIDIDFDARKRDRVAEYVYRKYGQERVAAVCTYNTFRARAAVRDLGKAMGIAAAELDDLAKRFPYYVSHNLEEALVRVPELRNSGLPLDKYRGLFAAAGAVIGFPRHLGTHMGGLVIGRHPLTGITPLQQAAKGVVVCQLDKRGVEELGLVKLDLLSLRTMSAVEDASRSIRRWEPGFDYERLPLDDQATFAMLNRGETIGVFQLESPAQRALQARLEADNLEDIVASVALIRPGPIKGNMVEPFIARRQGREPVTYLHPDLEPILKKTYGVVLFQEQVIEIATAIAGFSPGEADRLRRVMTHARSPRDMEGIGRLFVERSLIRGVDEGVARTIFSYIVGYASYGFCEAHAAAFATTAYKTAYLVRHHPAHFYAAVLNNQPMGFYPPNTISIEARRRGVTILPPDLNLGERDFAVQAPGIIRIGWKQVRGLSAATLTAMTAARDGGAFRSLPNLGRRTGMRRDEAEHLILAGALDSLTPNRRALLWQLDEGWRADGGRGSGEIPAQIGGEWREMSAEMPLPPVEDFSLLEKRARQYGVLGIDVDGHPLALLRPWLARRGFADSRTLGRLKPGTAVRVAGFPIRPHRPPTRSGQVIVFMSLEDEFGLAEVTVFEEVYQRDGQHIFRDPAPPLLVRGQVERRGRAASVAAARVQPLWPAGTGPYPASR